MADLAFLLRGLSQLLDEKDIRRSACAPLRKAARAALDEVTAIKNKAGATSDPDALPLGDKYYHVFKAACEQTRWPRLQSVALDALQKLIAYGTLKGHGALEGEPDRKLIDDVVDTICFCFVGEATVDDISLQIIKALLTAVTSSHCQVHEATLLNAIRTCFNVCIFSKNLVIQTTARASLTQMIDAVCQRMETSAVELNESSPNDEQKPDTLELSPDTISACSGESPRISRLASDADLEEENIERIHVKLADSAADDKRDARDNNVTHREAEALTNTDVEVKIADHTDKIPDADTKSEAPVVTGDGRSIPTIVEPVHESMGQSDVPKASLTPDEKIVHFSDIYQVDAYLVMRALCKLSYKDISGPAATDLRSHELRGKALSLELLLVILQNAGPVMQNHQSFVGGIKQYLCPSLLKNGVSVVPQVFELSLAIYLCLLASFKMHLKLQMEVFFKDIFLPVLATSASSFQHKWLVVQAISRICADPQTLVDLYVNYDCDLTLSNVFESMIADVSKIAMGRHAVDLGATGDQEAHAFNLRVMGLECLSRCLASMVEWISRPDSEYEAPGTPAPDNLSEAASFQEQSGANLQTLESPDDVMALKKRKGVVEEVVALFNEKPRKGVLSAQKKGMVGPTPEHVAEWFKTEERLSKTAIGEYLGDSDEFCLQVMYAYVDSMLFADLDFVSALRVFLEGFRLPGEAQKIDRLMEKFAARYCDNNPRYEIFENADTAYVLAYSIIMLTTDLHSPQVKKKMSLDEFVRNNRGINDGKDLPREFLSSVYDDIKTKEIRVQGDRSGTQKTQYSSAQLLNEKTRKMLYHQEMESRLLAAQALLEGKDRSSVVFVMAQNVAYAKSMFLTVWATMLAVLSVSYQSSADPYVVRLCLDGYAHAIHVSAAFSLDLQRNAFIQSLVQFSALLAGDFKLDTKKMECIKTLLHIASAHSNYLGASWYQMLKLISQLDLAINKQGEELALESTLSDSSLDSDMNSLRISKENFSLQAKGGSQSFAGSLASASIAIRGSPVITSSSLDLGRSVRDISAILRSGTAVEGDSSAQTLAVACDRVFSNSVNLSEDSILEFVKWLCVVSLEELSWDGPGSPRMYSLQKIVEISYYNMSRIRIEWSRVWSVLGEHFNKVGVHANLNVAMFAIDSLRQLSVKFLERGELAHFHFQKDFLKPFEYIMNHSKRPAIRDMVVTCLCQMIQSHAKNIRSGWKNIFFVLSLAAGDGNAPYVRPSFQTVVTVFTDHYDIFHDTAFVDGINCLVEFACNRSLQGMGMEAVGLIQQCVSKVAVEIDDEDGERVWVQGWFPILFGLHRIMTRCNLEVRTRALTVMIEAIKQYGQSFKRENWMDLFRITFRIFDDLKLPEQPSERVEWLNTTCNHALFAVLEIFGLYYDDLHDVVFQDLLDTIRWCCLQENEVLGRSATQSIQVLLLTNGRRMSPAMWDAAIMCVKTIFAESTPNELFKFTPEEIETQTAAGSAPFSFHGVIIKCVVQLEMVEAIEMVVLQETLAEDKLSHGEIEMERDPKNGMYEQLNDAQLLTLVDILDRSQNFAHNFNADTPLRMALWKAGFMRQLPNLLKQETTAMHAGMSILYRMYRDEQRDSSHEQVEERLFSLSLSLLGQFVELPSEKQRSTWAPLLLLLLSHINAMDHDRFSRHVSKSYALLSDLMALDIKPDLRDVLRETFRRIGTEFLRPEDLQNIQHDVSIGNVSVDNSEDTAKETDTPVEDTQSEMTIDAAKHD